MTIKEGIIITGYTGMMCVKDFSAYHKDVEERLGHPVWTHQFPMYADKIKEAYKEDFMELMKAQEDL